jgi:hypothetical protein
MECPSTGCAIDHEGCWSGGQPYAWAAGSDITFAPDVESAVMSGIDVGDAWLAVELAALAWSEATCAGDATPSVTLRVAERSDGKAKVRVKFRGGSWSGPRYALAGTTVSFHDGVVTAATVEVNTFGFDFSLEPRGWEADLVGVLTHEFGHVLGLGHSRVEGATMMNVSAPAWTDQLSTLTQDDVDGLCSLYPPGAKAPASSEPGGCSMSVLRSGAPPGPTFVALLLGASFVLSVRRLAARASQPSPS